ncbi:type IVB secretion system protein IcmG/DotF [Legionella jordanis]|uniref:Component of the Dot/Icm secretion system n=1 Tax=Legionella jordanis TaxID=456 RepID=A0A0W0VE10_9GAMM|nr:type IVB secretion system protein IcmG/DotF [Legionella jordanis]KTD18372.1 Component of the Dot/Icm secretion system [Legionella jordanis]RMX05282.1 type IV secretion protein IcmG [Legionella jordanis]RMX20867.1 type IV secretion protein IcmG [Legionella jordanis]VEH13282.1 Component of the Dot/Icm secretion system [Legionella jordanis]HAT8713630.1 type IV secretion protein IcmG [Legionella jordanis]
MAEDDINEYNEEYHFSDLDALEPEPGAEERVSTTTVEKRQTSTNLRRNAIIAIVVIVLLMLAYKFLGPLFTKKPPSDLVPPMNTTAQPITPAPTVTDIPPVTQPAAQPVQEQTTTTVSTQSSPANISSNELSQINQRLSTLEANQQNLRSEMDSLNNQLATVNSNINQLADKMAQLNQTFTILVSRVEQQSKELTILSVRAKPKVVKRVVIKTPPPPTYFIQAVIPGRAWLIAQNGSTITVREGTRVAGYGVVKLIDSRQGRVITSSGRVIRFSQQDS